MNGSWGSFTASGSPEVENRVAELVAEAAERIRAAVPENECRACVLIGGYGRGEGGVEMRAEVGEIPHNNLDFLFITKGGRTDMHAEWKRRIDAGLAPLMERHGVGMDVSMISERKLKSAPCLVIWYDMRFGHKTVLGDDRFVASLERFNIDRIEPSDVLNLLVNRGTLLAINDLVLQRRNLKEPERRLVIRHAVKGIIGYGDALLFFRGAYDWSYRKKQMAMRDLQGVHEPFRAMYDEAMEFRFRPDYARYLKRDLDQWMEELKQALEPVHLQCESIRLGIRSLSWNGYLEKALHHYLRQGWTRPREWAKKGYYFVRGRTVPDGLAGRAAAGYRCAGLRDLLPLLFPSVLYRVQDADFLRIASHTLSAEKENQESLRKAYLRAWGRVGDMNFDVIAKKFGLRLEKEGRVVA